MTKDELIAALQADPSPGDTPVVREFCWNEVCIEVRFLNLVRRDLATFSRESTDGRLLYRYGNSRNQDAVLTLSLD